jgi:hypothetical protein
VVLLNFKEVPVSENDSLSLMQAHDSPRHFQETAPSLDGRRRKSKAARSLPARC